MNGRGKGSPAQPAAIDEIDSSALSTNTLYISCAPVADCSGSTSAANGLPSLSQISSTLSPSASP